MYLTRTNPSLNSSFIAQETKKIAVDTLNFNLYKNAKDYLSLNYHLKPPKVNSIEKKSTEEIKNELTEGVQKILSDLTEGLKTEKLKDWLNNLENELNQMLESNEWRSKFQGKIIFSKLCSDVLKGDALRIKQAYVDLALQHKPEVLDDLVIIFNEMK